MDIKSEHVIIAFAVAIALVLLSMRMCSENFSSKREKAEAIAQWARKGNLSYQNYRSNITGADIVEYSDVKGILDKGPDIGALTNVVGKYK